MQEKRIGWIVSLRAIATMAIVLLHVVGGWIGEDWNMLTGGRMVLNEIIVQVLVRWAVPCFVMLSGFLILNPQKEYSISKIKQYIFRMGMVLVTFGMFFCLIEAYLNGYSQLHDLFFVSFKNLIEGKSWSHMWYVYMIIGLYILTPLLRLFVKNTDETTMKFTLLMLFVLSIIRPTINKLFEVEIASFIPISTSYLFYYLMGYYLLNKNWTSRQLRLSLCLGICGFILMLILKIKGFGVSVNADNCFVAIYSGAFLTLCKENKLLDKFSSHKWIEQISKYSFGIYIIHPVILNVLNKMFHIYPSVMPFIIGEIVFWIVALVGGYYITRILCILKPVRRIIL